MQSRDIQDRWKIAQAKADAAAVALTDLRAKGITDTTAAIAADLQRQLDEAEGELDRLEWEAGQG